MKALIKLMAAAAMSASAIAAHASTVTFDFTGTVTKATGIYASAGATVTGTFSINTDARILAFSSGTVGSTAAPWLARAQGGAFYILPTLSALVTGSTLTSGGVSFSDTAPSSFGNDDIVEAFANSTGPPNSYLFEDQSFSDSSTWQEGYFQLNGGTGASAPYDANGLPLFANATIRNGSLISSTGSRIDYTITSMTPVPLPASAWLLLSALGFLRLRPRFRST